jgi:hypothetical protein
MFISRHNHYQHWYTCPIALPVFRNPQNISLLIVVSAISTPLFQSLHHPQNVCHPAVNHFVRQTLPTVNRKHFFVSILCIESFYPQIMHNRTPLFYRTPLRHGCHFDCWNQPPNMRMHVCYLDSHEAGLCCYVVILHCITLHYIAFPESKVSQNDCRMRNMSYKYRNICTVQLKLSHKKPQENTVVTHEAVETYIQVYTSILLTYAISTTFKWVSQF